MSAGGKAVDVEMTDEMRHIVDLVKTYSVRHRIYWRDQIRINVPV